MAQLGPRGQRLTGVILVISQFDHGFQELICALTPFFPGIERWLDVTPVVPLTEAVLTLWEQKSS
jgi:hypothetical protein